MVFGKTRVPKKKKNVISFKIPTVLKIVSNQNRIAKNEFKIPILRPKESIFSRMESESNIPILEWPETLRKSGIRISCYDTLLSESSRGTKLISYACIEWSEKSAMSMNEYLKSSAYRHRRV